MPEALIEEIEDLLRHAHLPWLRDACATLEDAPEGLEANSLIAKLPLTSNGDVAYRLGEVIRKAEGKLSWEALGAAIYACSSFSTRRQQGQHADLLWSGPSPASQIPARRIDQVLYDLVASAKQEVLLVTFAAYKVVRLMDGLADAIAREIRVRLVLEFEEASQGQLSLDALNAFPEKIRQQAEIYYWPLDKRERNSSGNPGKLHAKAAVIDDHAVLSSANLTDDAFNRNLELGILLSGGEIPERIRLHIDALCTNGTLIRWNSNS